MKKRIVLVLGLVLQISFVWSQDFQITDVFVKKDVALEQLVFTVEVAGLAGDSVPEPIGALDGAPVLGYVFPTNLNPTDVGFDDTPGIVALALTSHPDFDDTPLWDENNDLIYDNDGIVWHPHWVLLENNAAVPGGLAVKATTGTSVLPPTNPGMPMYMDSPGYPVIWKNRTISCSIPFYRINYQTDFKYDGVTALMYVNTSDSNLPMLGVYEVYSVASGDLSLPYDVGNHSADTLFIDVSSSTGLGLIEPQTVKVFPNPSATDVQVELSSNFDLDTFEIQIFNQGGSLVFQSQLDADTVTIPVSQVGNPGVYILNVVESNSGVIKGTKQLVLF